MVSQSSGLDHFQGHSHEQVQKPILIRIKHQRGLKFCNNPALHSGNIQAGCLTQYPQNRINLACLASYVRK